jgi:hypothetical protein
LYDIGISAVAGRAEEIHTFINEDKTGALPALRAVETFNNGGLPCNRHRGIKVQALTNDHAILSVRIERSIEISPIVQEASIQGIAFDEMAIPVTGARARYRMRRAPTWLSIHNENTPFGFWRSIENFGGVVND